MEKLSKNQNFQERSRELFLEDNGIAIVVAPMVLDYCGINPQFYSHAILRLEVGDRSILWGFRSWKNLWSYVFRQWFIR